MRFDQNKTRVDQALNFTVDMFENQHTTSDDAKLLIILSDGRNLFAEGMLKVLDAVRRAKLADISLVFIIMDNPKYQVIFDHFLHRIILIYRYNIKNSIKLFD